MVVCCMPLIVRTPALRSSALNSFINRLLRRVHAADSNEHHAVLSVASAISKAATGSTHFFFSAGPLSDAAGGSGCVFMRLSSAAFVHALQKLFAYHDEEKCRGETEHQNAGKSLHRAKHSPFFWQNEIAVADRGVGYCGKIERGLHIRHTLLPPEKQC